MMNSGKYDKKEDLPEGTVILIPREMEAKPHKFHQEPQTCCAKLAAWGTHGSKIEARPLPLEVWTDKSRKENFFYGMLSTCGLENTGSGCTVDGKEYVQHGSLNQMPAADVRIERYGEPSQPDIRITGTVTQYLFREYHYQVTREINYHDRTSEICIRDRVMNLFHEEIPVCIMYHYNFGYPFLSEALELSIPSLRVGCKNEDAEAGLSAIHEVTPPKAGFRPQVFYHSFMETGWNEVLLKNQELSMGVRLSFHGSTLSKLNHWKMFGEREYVLALEPCNEFPYGRKSLTEKNCQKILRPHESAEYETKLGFFRL